MSRSYSAWARKIRIPRATDKSVLREIADRVKDDGIWQFCLKDLADAVGMSRNSLRRSLDRLAAMSMVAFKAERYRGGEAQAGHRFILIRNEEELRSAEALGFSRTRQALERASSEEPEEVMGRSKMDRGVGPDWEEGGSNPGRRVGPLLDPRTHNPNPLSKHKRAPAARSIAVQGDLISDDLIGGQAHKPPPGSAPPRPESAKRKSEAFDRFWKAWPNHVARAAAIKAFAKHADKIDEILVGVERYVRNKPADRPWLNPATFLNQERWDDRPAPLHGGVRPVQRASPDDPEVMFPGGYKRRESVLRGLIARCAGRPRNWPAVLGPPPGDPGCLVPKHLLNEASVSA